MGKRKPAVGAMIGNAGRPLHLTFRRAVAQDTSAPVPTTAPPPTGMMRHVGGPEHEEPVHADEAAANGQMMSARPVVPSDQDT